MRPSIPAMFLSALLVSVAGASPAQAPAPALTFEGALGQSSSPFTQQPRDFSKLPPGWRMPTDQPRTTTIIEPAPEAPAPGPEWIGARIDPGIIVHPPQSSIGVEPPGAQVARNEFPGLMMQPVQWPLFKLQPIPTTWPLLKLQPIPTTYPRSEALLFQPGTSTWRPGK
jgi:hypothetical protein